jgi:hypothetical protein
MKTASSHKIFASNFQIAQWHNPEDHSTKKFTGHKTGTVIQDILKDNFML